ncbi:MAG TPA: hypothetical protein VNA04_05380 [Thermoanaerobaculia bacterium]|nr:hypothetical protein [Thermoanaerobaculia bacterium]
MARKSGAERRKKQRVKLTRGIIARFGTTGAIVLDITDAGARIEHFVRLELGRKARFRFEWQQKEIDLEATVRSCRVHRFAHGDEGTTVYQSGLLFADVTDDAAATLREMVATIVSRSLAEQVANARGIGPVTERNMPVFRSGAVVGGGLDRGQGKAQRYLPTSEVAVDRGYTRCTLVANRRWEQKWTRSPDQPPEGFTVLATEPQEHVDQLCETYLQATEDGRRLIRRLAEASVEHHEETPEPREL